MLGSAGAATALAAVTVAAAVHTSDDLLVPVIAGWWVVALIWGFVLGRGSRTNQSIERLLAGARSATSLPEQRPGTVLLNRLFSASGPACRLATR